MICVLCIHQEACRTILSIATDARLERVIPACKQNIRRKYQFDIYNLARSLAGVVVILTASQDLLLGPSL